MKSVFRAGFRPVAAIVTALLLAGAAFAVHADKIDINRADATALAALNGVGPARAEAIVEYRRINGPFRSVEELTEVKGLGTFVLERNRDRLTVGEDPAAAP